MEDAIQTSSKTHNIIQNIFTPTCHEHECINISFENLSFTVSGSSRKEKKEILHKINGKFDGGQLIAIIGPSGAGKTTLLESLCGYKVKDTNGEIFVNEKLRDLKTLKNNSCYIPDKNHLQPLLTVWENMKFAADLRLNQSISPEKKDIIIGDILTSLFLESLTHFKVECLSGGQQKRLSIALELVKNPMIMFLDEPTTGLDSYSCFQSVRLLKKLAKQGKTIICTIHQPSTSLFQLFDHVYIVASGKCVYQGAPNNLVKFLENANFRCPKYYNPVDYIVELISSEYENLNISTLVELSENGKSHQWLQNSLLLSKVRNDVQIYNNNNSIDTFREFQILIKRCFLKAKRDQTLTYTRLAVNLFIGILYGCLYWQAGIDGYRVPHNSNLVYSVLIHHMMSTMMLTLISISKNVSIITNEYFNGWYSLKVFFTASTLCDIPISVLCCSLFTFIVYPMTGQPMELARFSMFTIISIMVILVSQSLGLLIGSNFNIVNGTFVGFSVAVPTIALGNFAGLSNLPMIDWFTYASYMKYGFEGMFGSIYGFNRSTLYCPDDKYCHYKYPKHFLKDKIIEPDQFWIDFLVLSVFFILIKVITYKVYKFKLNHC